MKDDGFTVLCLNLSLHGGNERIESLQLESKTFLFLP